MQAPKLENLKFEEQDIEIFKALGEHIILSVNDKYGRVTYANNNFCGLLGLSRKFILGSVNEILKSDVHINKIYKDLWKTIKKGDRWEGVLFHQISESKFYWLQTTVYPIKDKNGGVKKYLSIYNDITDYYQKQTIDHTVEVGSEIILRKINKITLSINERAKIIRANNHFLKKDYDEVVGSYIYDFVNEDYHKSIRSKIREVFSEGKPSNFQFSSCKEILNKDIYVSEVLPVFNKTGEVTHATITTELRTKDVKILRELNEIQTKYKSVLKSFSHGIVVVTDAEGVIKEWNKGAEKAFDYNEKEIIGKPITTLISKDFLDEGITELLKIKESFVGTEMGETIQMVVVKKDGSEFPVEIAVNDWYCGKTRYFSAIMLDVSMRESLKKRLIQKSEDLELFLYRSAHDLKAPLTSAEGLIELIKGENIDKNTAELVEMLNSTIHRGKLILDNLAFASSISQKKCQVEVINMKKEIQKTLNILRGLDGFEDIIFDVTVEQPKRFYSNKELICSVFQNLIQNAIIYSKPRTKQFQPKIEVSVVQTQETVNILISDNGLGISKENQSNVFNLYYRVSNEGVQGTGLGLYIVKSIIEDLDGTISLDSEVAQGTSFKISIPNLSIKKK